MNILPVKKYNSNFAAKTKNLEKGKKTMKKEFF